MKKAAVILAGGFAHRVGQDKGLLQLGGKPLIQHVLNKVRDTVDEVLVIVNSEFQADAYRNVLGSGLQVVVDHAKVNAPLAGAAVGFGNVSATYSLLLPCDVPFVSGEILELLLELCIGRNAAIPRWPNCYIEPLHAAYCTEFAKQAAEDALAHGELKMQCFVEKLSRVRYISTLVLEQLDPDLKTFFNINTMLDLKKAENMLKMK